jgi:hypothetical protein
MVGVRGSVEVGLNTSRAALKNLEDDVGQSSFRSLDGPMPTSHLSCHRYTAAIAITASSRCSLYATIDHELDCVGVGACPHFRFLDVYEHPRRVFPHIAKQTDTAAYSAP